MKSEYAVFFKVEESEDLTDNEISKKMDHIATLLNKKYKGKRKFRVIDIRKKPSK